MMRNSLLLLLCLTCTIVVGQEKVYKNAFGFRSDNDAYLFYGQDRYYTNGLFIYFRHAADQQGLKPDLEKTIYEFSAGQKMYNPYSGYAPDPTLHDRPFAGYLYGSAAGTWFFKNESSLKGALEIGTIGPSSLAEDAQEVLHNLTGFYEIAGWQYQVKDAFAVNANLKYVRLLHRAENKSTEFSFEGNVGAGTVFSSAGAAVLFRVGRINQLFNSAATHSELSNNSSTKPFTKKEIYFYAKPQLSYIAYDATVQGSMFKKDSPVTFGIKPLVFTQTFGFNYSTPRFTFDYSILFKSREIKSTALPHQYGSISMYYRFN